MRPIRSACLGTATALVTRLACAPVAAAAATDHDSAHAESKGRVITLTGRLAQQSRFPVNPGGSPAQGDRTVFRSVLYDQKGKQVGETGGTCTTTRVEDGGAEECVVTYTLPDGRLSVQGMLFGILVPGPPPSFDNAITGGTGKYERARGSVHADTIAPGKRRFTIHLV
ncbi:allene oxide cyclase barrel-like domain-containing protein [Streptomyces tanashiensis]|uniref:allene oxide cyclase barrel-like domain-containing protein n=1 Tax=Streptomyces tanashiensis TaxID=67367 RepID=UPI0034222EA9